MTGVSGGAGSSAQHTLVAVIMKDPSPKVWVILINENKMRRPQFRCSSSSSLEQSASKLQASLWINSEIDWKLLVLIRKCYSSSSSSSSIAVL